jgi:hypothetical protein
LAISLVFSGTASATLIDVSTTDANFSSYSFNNGNSIVAGIPDWVNAYNYSITGPNAWWELTYQFNVSQVANISSALLNENYFFVDDRGVIEVNGHIVLGGTSGQGGIGQFAFDPTNPNLLTSQSFAQAPTPAVYDITSYLVQGVNNFTILVNNTGSGINGTITDIGPSSVGLSGYISVNAVPLPGAAWLLGSALVGLIGFNRRKTN